MTTFRYLNISVFQYNLFKEGGLRLPNLVRVHAASACAKNWQKSIIKDRANKKQISYLIKVIEAVERSGTLESEVRRFTIRSQLTQHEFSNYFDFS